MTRGDPRVSFAGVGTGTGLTGGSAVGLKAANSRRAHRAKQSQFGSAKFEVSSVRAEGSGPEVSGFRLQTGRLGLPAGKTKPICVGRRNR
jgi:hypothetical protein